MSTEPQPHVDAPLGRVLRDERRVGLRFRRSLSHPPERVWRALTEADDLRHWFPADMVGERRAGAPLRFPFWAEHREEYGIEETGGLAGTLLAWEPPHLLELTWDGDHLRWELRATPTGTDLVLTTWLGTWADGGLDADGAVDGGLNEVATGYHVCLDLLAELLDTGAAGGVRTAREDAWRERYADAVAQARAATS